MKVSPWGVLLGPGGCCCCVSGPGAFFVVVRFSLLWLGFLLASTLCFKRKDGDPGTDQLFLEDPADWHRPENRNSFRYPQRLRRTSTAKCSLKVSSWPDPVHRDGSGHRKRGCSPCDGCCGWRSPDSGAASNWRRNTKAAGHNPSVSVAQVFWDFGSLHQRRRGVVSYALLREPYLRVFRCGDFGFMSQHRNPGVSEIPDVAASLLARCRSSHVLSLKDVALDYIFGLFYQQHGCPWGGGACVDRGWLGSRFSSCSSSGPC